MPAVDSYHPVDSDGIMYHNTAMTGVRRNVMMLVESHVVRISTQNKKVDIYMSFIIFK
jgi:hypothetical protein